MNFFKTIPQFDCNTGKPKISKKVEAGLLCDYCGKLLLPEEQDGGMVQYQIVEPGECEPGYHELRITGHDVDRYTIMENHPAFVYCYNWNNGSSECERKMIASALKSKKGYFSLSGAMYEARFAMLKKLLDAKTYTLEQLGLE